MLDFKISKTKKADTITFTVKGHLDYISVQELAYELTTALEEEPTEIILNMTQVYSFCPTGTKALHSFKQTAQKSNCLFILEHPSSVVINIIGKAELDMLMKI